MDNKLSFEKFATALAAFGVSSLTVGAALASPVQVAEFDASESTQDTSAATSSFDAQTLAEKDEEAEKDAGYDKKKKSTASNKEADDKKKNADADKKADDKKKNADADKKKKHGGEEGGCGAGTCG